MYAKCWGIEEGRLLKRMPILGTLFSSVMLEGMLPLGILLEGYSWAREINTKTLSIY